MSASPTPFVPIVTVFDTLGVTPTYVLRDGTTYLVYELPYGGHIAGGNPDGSAQAWHSNLRDASGKIVAISGAEDAAAWNAYVAANGINPAEQLGEFPKPVKLTPTDASAVSGGVAPHPATVAQTPTEVTHTLVETSLWQRVKDKLADLGHDIEKII